jgi:hypothetical protein
MENWGIKNYQPQWKDSATGLLELIEKAPLIGYPVEELWSLWDKENDEWFSDAPVIIGIQGRRFEFCATKLNTFSFSVDSIDVRVPVYWCSHEDSDIEPFHWVRRRNPEFADLVGEEISGIEIIESCDLDVSSFMGLEPEMLIGVALLFEDKRLEILNGLDCNFLSRSYSTDERWRYIQVEARYNRVEKGI